MDMPLELFASGDAPASSAFRRACTAHAALTAEFNAGRNPRRSSACTAAAIGMLKSRRPLAKGARGWRRRVRAADARCIFPARLADTPVYDARCSRPATASPGRR